MTRPIVLSTLAKADVDEIVAYIEERDPVAAKRVIDRVYQRLALAATSLDACEGNPSRHSKTRRVTIGSYVAFFEQRSSDLYVYRILHGARDIDSLMD